jgi:hypothetical protein
MTALQATALAPCPVVAATPALVTSLCCGSVCLANHRFCGGCGAARPLTQTLPAALRSVNWQLVCLVAAKHAAGAGATKHRAKEQAALDSFAVFCASLPDGAKSVAHAGAAEVIWFLAWRATHGGGRTVVHDITCAGTGACACPVLLKASTMQKLLGSLRRELAGVCGGVSGHSALAESTNPAAAPEVERWLVEYEKAQNRAGVTTTQVTPVFEFDTAKFAVRAMSEHQAAVSRYADSSSVSDLRDAFMLAQVRALALCDGRTGQRPGDLCQTLCRATVRFPANDGFLFNWTAGKTYRDGHMFGMPRDTDAGSVTCGCAALEHYVGFCKGVLDWDMSGGGYLFPAVSATGELRRVSPLTPLAVAKASALFASVCERAGIPGRHTLSGYRSGTAVTNALKGDSLMSVMDTSYWKTSRTALHYLKILEVLGHSGIAQRAQGQQQVTAEEYASIMNSPADCCAAF